MSGVTERSGGWLWIEPGAAGLRPDMKPLQRVHALVWRQLNPTNPRDKWSQEILDFKADEARAFESVTSLLLDRLPRLLDDLGLAQRQMNLVTALSAADTGADPGHPLYKVAKAVEREIAGCRFESRLLSKEPHDRLQQLTDFASRDMTVAGKYEIGTNMHTDKRGGSRAVFLVLDDFVTRGATLADIARAITDVWPKATVHALALAKHVYQDVLSGMGYAEDDNERRLGKKS